MASVLGVYSHFLCMKKKVCEYGWDLMMPRSSPMWADTRKCIWIWEMQGSSGCSKVNMAIEIQKFIMSSWVAV